MRKRAAIKALRLILSRSPIILEDTTWTKIWVRCSWGVWSGLDTLEIFRRDIDSHAIALYILSWEWHEVTRWGLFLLRWVHHIFFGSIAYGKRGYSSRDWDIHSNLRWCEGSQLAETCCSDALSKELDPVEMRLFQVMNTNIESSTEGVRVKSDAPVDDTICVMVSDEISESLHLFLSWLVSPLFTFFVL